MGVSLFYFFFKEDSLCHIISVFIFMSNLWRKVFLLYGKGAVDKPPHAYDSVRIISISTFSFQIKETNV